MLTLTFWAHQQGYPPNTATLPRLLYHSSILIAKQKMSLGYWWTVGKPPSINYSKPRYL